MLHPVRSRRRAACVAIGTLLALASPLTAAAHAELTSSTPADGATVPSPFGGPVVLSFSEALGDASTAELTGQDGTTVASAEVDAPGGSMTITLAATLDPGEYEVQWTTVADDGHVERGTISFTVAPAPATLAPTATAAPTAAPTIERTPAPTATAAAAGTTPPPSPELSVPPNPTPSDDGTGAASGADAILPIVVVLIILGVGAAYLLRQRRSTAPR